MYNAEFIKSDLSNANLTRANLDQAKFEDIFVCGKLIKGTFRFGSLFDSISELLNETLGYANPEESKKEKSILELLSC